MKPTDTFDHMLRDPEFHNKELQCNNCLIILFIVWCKVHQSAFENNFCIKVDQCNPRPHGSSCQRRQEPAQRRPISRFFVLGARISTLKQVGWWWEHAWRTCMAPFENLSINPRYQILWNYKKGKHFLNQHSEICDIWNHFLHWSRYWKISPWDRRETTQLCIVVPPSDRQSTTCNSINNWSPAICSTFTWGGTLSPGSGCGSVSWPTGVSLS